MAAAREGWRARREVAQSRAFYWRGARDRASDTAAGAAPRKACRAKDD
jgi:hypothetical protein